MNLIGRPPILAPFDTSLTRAFNPFIAVEAETGELAPDHIADANTRLSLVGIDIGKHVIQDDNMTEYVYNGDAEAVQIIGAGTEAANGYYTKRGTLNGKGFHQLIGVVTDFSSKASSVYWTGDSWVITNGAGDGFRYTSIEDVASPWLVATWNAADGAEPVPTTAHIASKNALLTCAFVSLAGTVAANGIYTERPGLGERVAGRKTYNLLGQSDSEANSSIVAGNVTKWAINDSGGSQLYTSTDNVQYPWLVTTWVAVAVPLEHLPTVVSKTQGELDAGVLVTGAETTDRNFAYVVDPSQNYPLARNGYLALFSSATIQLFDPAKENWTFTGDIPASDPGDNPAFPWEASFNDSATVAQNNIASESNWEPLP